jgi:pyrroline-5-carboxylate reductase
MREKKHLFFLGAGSMAEAMVKGMLAAELFSASQLTVSNRSHTARLHELHSEYAVNTCQSKEDKAASAAAADIIVVAVKPFDVAAALENVQHALRPDHLIISVAAGVSTGAIETYLGGRIPVVRAMPNTSSFVQESATAISAGHYATPGHIEDALQIFSAIGSAIIVEEGQLDAVTGLSGSGPAYIYYVVEALLDAGIACGLPQETSQALVLQTLVGAVKMLKETGTDPAELRHQVTSPNGTTMAGLQALEQGNAASLFLQAVKQATARSVEMGKMVSTTILEK